MKAYRHERKRTLRKQQGQIEHPRTHVRNKRLCISIIFDAIYIVRSGVREESTEMMRDGN